MAAQMKKSKPIGLDFLASCAEKDITFIYDFQSVRL
jgi:hypothetical protein